MKRIGLLAFLILGFTAEAKNFRNSYIAFDVPDDWNCVQEGVAWTCSPLNPLQSKEAIIVIVAKVAGPEDNLQTFFNYLKQPKKIPTKVGTPMPSIVNYSQMRQLAGQSWVQAQHLGSEVQDYYTLYLATVKDQLAILVTFSAEQNRYQAYNGVFDKAMKTLQIVANQKLLFPKTEGGPASDVIGIQVAGNPFQGEDMRPPPEKKPMPLKLPLVALFLLAAAGAVFFVVRKNRNKNSSGKSSRNRTR